MINLDFLKHLDRFNLIIHKKVTSNYSGPRTTEQVGEGLVFREHSSYVAGEDIRRIDWNVYARTEKLHVKKFEAERNLVTHIILDYSGSMNFGEGTKKYEYAAMLGIGFAYMALKNNEKFVLSTFSDRLDLFRQRKGKSQLASIYEYLNKKKAGGKSRFGESVTKYKKRVTSKSLIVVVSDFLYDTEEMKYALYKYKGHEIILIQVLDPIEVKMDLSGDFRLEDAESSGILRTFISPFLRKKYKDKLADHQAKIKEIAGELKAKFFVVPTDSPIFDTFYKVLV
jgi:uncharacterized protein (DUF58 family)